MINLCCSHFEERKVCARGGKGGKDGMRVNVDCECNLAYLLFAQIQLKYYYVTHKNSQKCLDVRRDVSQFYQPHSRCQRKKTRTRGMPSITKARA